MTSTHSPQNAANAEARSAAMAAVEGLAVTPAGVVQYSSRGRVAVIGDQEALDYAPCLLPELQVQVLLTEGIEEPSVPIVAVGGREIRVSGHLGAFEIGLGEEGKPNYERIAVDLVLDLSPEPLFEMALKPPGYFCSPVDDFSLERVREDLISMVGTFEKPRFFDYNPSICAHSRSGLDGCTRCIDACPAEAIQSLGDLVEVDPFRCQGGGVCATVCPTGAMRYTYPRAADTLERVRRLLHHYREAGGSDPVLAVVAESDVGLLDQLPDNLLTLVVEELASVGLELWLSALAYGARCVLLINGDSQPDSVQVALDEQLAFSGDLLGGMGYPENAVRLVNLSAIPAECEACMPDIKPAGHAGLEDKRQAAFMALDYLCQEAGQVPESIGLKDGAPFGRLHVDAEKCTLCMGCTSVCPAKAVQAGNETPRLVFTESLCVQCGLCEQACPENAISLQSRYVTNAAQRRSSYTLYEEPPFHCISCGKPFATRSVIDTMMTRLDGHWMFQGERAKRRLMMCEDCRVIDAVQDPEAIEAGIVSGVPPRN